MPEENTGKCPGRTKSTGKLLHARDRDHRPSGS